MKEWGDFPVHLRGRSLIPATETISPERSRMPTGGFLGVYC